MLTRFAHAGFSMVELSIALTIIAILTMLGMPSFTEYIQNARLGAAAQSFYSGLNFARSEAVRRNGSVEFAMTNSTLGPGIENSLVADVTGKNWVVRAKPTGAAVYDPALESKTALEGGGLSNPVTVLASSAIVTFDSIGAATISPPATSIAIQIKNPAAGQCAPAGPVRCWNVVVAPGGQVHLCDPTAAAGDSRAC